MRCSSRVSRSRCIRARRNFAIAISPNYGPTLRVDERVRHVDLQRAAEACAPRRTFAVAVARLGARATGRYQLSHPVPAATDGDLPKLDAALFSAIHQQQRRLFDEQSLADWVGANGGDSAKFASAFSSFGVNSQVAQADKMSDDYGVAGVPTMAVDGKYVALGDTHEQILANVDALVAKARAQHPTAGAASKPK